MAQASSSIASQQPSKPESPQSSLSKMPVLPPIATPVDGPAASDSSDVTRPPSPTGALPNVVTNENLELFLEKKLSLIKFIMNAPDILEKADKYAQWCRTLSHGTLERMNPQFSNRLRLANLFADNGYFPFIIKYWEMLNLKTPEQWPDIVKSQQLTSQCGIFANLLGPMWNGTDMGDLDYLKKFDDALRLFYLQVLDSPVMYTPGIYEVQKRILRSLLGTLHNVVHKYPSGSGLVRDSGGVRIVSRYIANPDMSTKTKALLVLAYIVSEDEQNKLTASEDHIKYFIMVLADCVKGSPKHYSRSYGYVAEEILEGLNRMAGADVNKAAIVKCGALPLYAALLQDDCDTTEQAIASKGLWILAFNAENKKAIKQQPGCMEGLTKLCSSSDVNVRRAAEGALWAIDGENRRVQQTLEATLAKSASITTDSSSAAAGHIMISYNWGVQPEVIKIKDRLKAAGYKVWIDVEQMSGSTLDAMASSIEEASLVLIFFTEQYKMSPSCRSEAEYCYKMHKPFIPVRMQQKYSADGWLGMILGTKLFYDFTKHDIWESTFDNLRKGIDQILKIKPTDNGESHAHASTPARPAQSQATAIDTRDSAVQLAASSWTESDVKKWICEHGLQDSCHRFSGFTGADIVELQRVLLSAPSYFYKLLEQRLGMPLKDVMTFTRILRELN